MSTTSFPSETLSITSEAEGIVQRYLDKQAKGLPCGDLRDLVMVHYAGLVERTARKFAGIEPFEDLVQVGFIGLLNALGKFDPEAGVRFNTYATYLVAGEMKHYLRDKTGTIRQPAWLQELRHKVNRGATMLTTELGRVPTEREIAEAIGTTEAAVKEVFLTQDLLRVGSLDAMPMGDEEAESELDKIDAAQFSPAQLSVEDRVVLEAAMSQLRDLERDVLTLFHFEALNQTEIAAKLGISCNYVSHILRQSLGKLRKILSNEEAKDRMIRRQERVGGGADHDIVDGATGAYTEAYFRTRLQEEIHRASFEGAEVGVMVVTFDGLQGLRKFYGAASVEAFLFDAAEFFRDGVRRLDVVARFGESGFAIILPSSRKNVAAVKERLHAKLEAWVSGRYGNTGAVGVTVAEAEAPHDGKSANDVLAHMGFGKPATYVAPRLAKAA